MLYTLLCYNREDVVWSWTKEEDEAVMSRLSVVHERLVKEGKLGPSLRLLPTTAATTLRGGGIVIDGPFAETKELVSGFWIWKVKSMEDAVSWARRCPIPMPGEVSVLEIRPVFEPEDFGAEYTPELQARNERLRVEIEQQQKQ